MNSNFHAACCVAGVTALSIALPVTAAAQSQSSANADNVPGAVDAITLYSQGAAVVQNSRRLDLAKGTQTVDWPAAGAVDADSLWVAGQGMQLIGFQMSGNGRPGSDPLSARIGHSVTLSDNDGQARQGTLMSVNADTAYVRVNGRMQRITAGSPTQISWALDDSHSPDLAQSRLRLQLRSDSAGQKKITAAYQIAAPSWQASYTGRFDPITGTLALQANAVIDNSGNAALNADKAWLVAGDVSRAGGGHGPRPMMMARAKAASDAVGSPQASGAVYRYPLSGGLHVPAGITQAVALIKPTSFKAQREYRFNHYALSDTGKTRSHADVQLSFTNHSDAPLPAGAIRVYDASGDAQLMGASQIGDTPKNAPVELSLGQAFDITGTHQIVDQSTADAKSPSRTVKITLYNVGKKSHTVEVSENLPNGATLADDAPRTTGGTATQPAWNITVPAGGQNSLIYTLNLPARP
ncbi:MAG: hypothetical protein PF501_18620 [Salinisphaera sp.]|jgi:hypothetical protein|nr:hypothetical protein [Salinisphaera sp.]